MEVSSLQHEQPSSEEQMQPKKNISSLPSLLARQHQFHLNSPLLLMNL
jgi:hypothetical protein